MSEQSVLKIEGVVRRGETPVEGAYLDLCRDGDFIAERRTGPDGSYSFHTTPGSWEIRCRAAGSDMRTQTIDAEAGEVSVHFDLGS